MLAACAARLSERTNLVWIDLGGGTGVSLNINLVAVLIKLLYPLKGVVI